MIFGFYKDELKLNNEVGERFEEYYISKVYDYGLVLEDLVQKKVPSIYGVKPNAPVLERVYTSIALMIPSLSAPRRTFTSISWRGEEQICDS